MNDPKDTKDKNKKQHYTYAKVKKNNRKKHLSSHLFFTTSAQSNNEDGKIDSLYAKSMKGPEVPTNETPVTHKSMDKLGYLMQGFIEELM